MRRWRWGLMGFLLLALGLLPLAGAAEISPELLKNLHYRVSLGPWQDAAKMTVSFKDLGEGRYLAECSGDGQGVGWVLSRWLPERCQTEMSFEGARFKPLVYREELRIKGERVVKEYRFDYDQGSLAQWRQASSRPAVKKWQVPLTGPVLDPLSLIYNLRLGALGPLKPGETLRVGGIPTPEPQEMCISLGASDGRGRNFMITVKEQSGEERGPYFLHLAPEGTPTQVWTRVFRWGKLMGSLLPVDSGG